MIDVYNSLTPIQLYPTSHTIRHASSHYSSTRTVRVLRAALVSFDISHLAASWLVVKPKSIISLEQRSATEFPPQGQT